MSALDPKTGRMVWEAGLPASLDAAPVVIGGTMVWAGNETRRVYGFDLNTKRQRWSTVGRSTVLAPGLDDTVLANADIFGEMRAIGLHRGRELWRSGKRSREYIHFITLADRKAFTDQYVVDASNGRVLASYETTRLIAAGASGDLVVAVDSGGLVRAIDAVKLKTVWAKQVFGPTSAAIAATSGGLVAIFRYDGWPFAATAGELLVLDVNSGTLLWKTAVEAEGRPLPAQVLGIANQRVYLNTPSGVGSTLQALDAESGKIIWTAENLEGLVGGLMAVGDLIFAVSRSDRVHCFSGDDGSLLWSVSFSKRGVAAGTPK